MMSRRLSATTLGTLGTLFGLVHLAGCPSPETIPGVLGLGLECSATRARLVEDEPPPF